MIGWCRLVSVVTSGTLQLTSDTAKVLPNFSQIYGPHVEEIRRQLYIMQLTFIGVL